MIHLRLTKQTENHLYNWNAVSAFVNSTPLVVDFSYFSQMDSKKHIKSLVFKEIVNAYTFNRTSRRYLFLEPSPAITDQHQSINDC